MPLQSLGDFVYRILYSGKNTGRNVLAKVKGNEYDVCYNSDLRQHMLSDEMRQVARDAGLSIVPYQSDLGFTAVRENENRCFVFVLNTGEWMIYGADDVFLMASGSGPTSLLAALRRCFDVPVEIVPNAAA